MKSSISSYWGLGVLQFMAYSSHPSNEALLRWRGQRLAWGGRSSPQMNEAIERELQLVPLGPAWQTKPQHGWFIDGLWWSHVWLIYGFDWSENIWWLWWLMVWTCFTCRCGVSYWTSNIVLVHCILLSMMLTGNMDTGYYSLQGRFSLQDAR